MGKNHPLHIQKNHWDEWTTGSAIDSELTALNLQSISGQIPYERLLYNWESCLVHLDAIWRRINRRFGDNWWDGGWWCGGSDDSQWGCFKPDRPRLDKSKGFDPNKPKYIKYEHPAQVSTEIFRLKMPRHLWQRIANRYNIPIGNYNDFWQWVLDHPQIPITITEGVKKAGALLSKGYVALALPGVWSGVRTPKDEEGNPTLPSHLIPQLKQFAQPDRLVHLAFDQDKKQSTRKNVNRAIAKTGILLKKSGCQVKVVSWDANYKGIDDFIVVHGNRLDQVFQEALDFELWQALQLTELTYPVDLTINSRYFGRIAPPEDKQVICLVGGKGTGKTHSMSDFLQPYLSEGGKALVIGHRIQLTQQIVTRFGVDYVTQRHYSETKGVFGYGLCIDSLHPNSQAQFNPTDWEGAWIFIDECEQVIWHLLNSSTCLRERVSILRNFQEVLRIALSTGGKVFLSDADLSDVSIDYIKSLVGFKVKTWIAKNEYLPQTGWDVYSYGGNSPAQLVGDLIEHISQGGKPFICTGGQKIKSNYSTTNLESLLSSRFPDLKILRIDSESVADPNHPAYGCIEHLNELLPEYDIAIASPTLETGVSIDCGHLKSVWGIFPGHQPVHSVCQFLARERANVPRYIWARTTGFGRIGNGSTSVKSILKVQHKMTRANISLLNQADFEDKIDTGFQPESLLTWAKLSARINLGMKNYLSSILSKLQDEGHHIIDAVPPSDDDCLKDQIEAVEVEVKETKEENYQNHCEAIAAAPDLDKKQFLKIKDQRAKTLSERRKCRKGELKNRYGVEVTPTLVKKDDDGWYRLLRLHYFFSVGREHLSASDKATARKMLSNGGGAIFKPDFNKKQLGAKIAILDLIGFALLLVRRSFRQDDPELAEIADFCKRHSFEIHACLGVRIRENDSVIQVVQKLLGLIGYKLPRLRREGSGRNGSDRIYVYGAAAPSFRKDCLGRLQLDDNGQAIPIPDGRDEVFAAWLEREAAKQAIEEEVARLTEGGLGSDFASTPNNNRSINTTHGRNPMDAPPSPAERLLEALSRVSSYRQFWQTIRGYEDEVVEDAIALQDTYERRQTLFAWFKGDTEVTLKDTDRFLESDSIQDIAHSLQSCCKEVLAILRQTIPLKEAFRQAVRLLSPERRAIIRRWVIELNISQS